MTHANLLLVQFHKFSIAIIWCWHYLHNLRCIGISSLHQNTHSKGHRIYEQWKTTSGL